MKDRRRWGLFLMMAVVLTIAEGKVTFDFLGLRWIWTVGIVLFLI